MSRVVTFILTISLHLNIAATKREDLESVSIKIGGVPIVIPDFQVGPQANKARGDSTLQGAAKAEPQQRTVKTRAVCGSPSLEECVDSCTVLDNIYQFSDCVVNCSEDCQ